MLPKRKGYNASLNIFMSLEVLWVVESSIIWRNTRAKIEDIFCKYMPRQSIYSIFNTKWAPCNGSNEYARGDLATTWDLLTVSDRKMILLACFQLSSSVELGEFTLWSVSQSCSHLQLMFVFFGGFELHIRLRVQEKYLLATTGFRISFSWS